MKKYFLSLFLIIFSFQLIYAQNDYNFKTFGKDSEKFIHQPVKWSAKDGLILLGISGLTYSSMFFDNDIQSIALQNDQYKNTFLVELGRLWGEGWLSPSLGSLIYISGLANENSHNKKIGYEILSSSVYTGLITMILKFGFGRERPTHNSNQYSFYPLSLQGSNFLSLNSGHTALAFSTSTILAKNTDNNFLKVAFYFPAFLTAFSRVYQNHHWLSDVILGGFIGYFVADFVAKIHMTKNYAEIVPNPNTVNFKLLNYSIYF